MPSRKRALSTSMENTSSTPLLTRIRNMWQFANLCQWIYTFGHAAKINESLDIEDLETECLKDTSTALTDIALALLKLVSSHRGLTYDILNDQLRKEFASRSPDHNPFGDSESPTTFLELSIFNKIRVLQQLTQWAMISPERIREKMEEQKDTEQTSWRIEPYGWDSQDRTYYVLDDNRVYRLSDPPPQSAPVQKKKRSISRRRSSKRRRIESSDEPDDEATSQSKVTTRTNLDNDGLGGYTWECVAITLSEVQCLIESLTRTRDKNEKVLRSQLEIHLLPILEKQEDSRKRKELQRERELINLAKMANAKRSSRIAGKKEQQKQEQKEHEEMEQAREIEAARQKEERTRLALEQERQARMASRATRIKDRESRRRQHEDELAQLSESGGSSSLGNARISERRLQAEIERTQQALKDIEQEEEDWAFDCMCGTYGKIDDGTHSVACEKCNIWQHSRCLGIAEEEADHPQFHFICSSCKRRANDNESGPSPNRVTIKLKVHPTGQHQDTNEAPALKVNQSISASTQPFDSLPAPNDKLTVFAQLGGDPQQNLTESLARDINPLDSDTVPTTLTSIGVSQPVKQHSHNPTVVEIKSPDDNHSDNSLQPQSRLYKESDGDEHRFSKSGNVTPKHTDMDKVPRNGEVEVYPKPASMTSTQLH